VVQFQSFVIDKRSPGERHDNLFKIRKTTALFSGQVVQNALCFLAFKLASFKMATMGMVCSRGRHSWNLQEQPFTFCIRFSIFCILRRTRGVNMDFNQFSASIQPNTNEVSKNIRGVTMYLSRNPSQCALQV